MKCEWKTVNIGDLGAVVTGKTPSTKKTAYWNGSVHFVTPKDLQESKHILHTERTITSDGLEAVRGCIIPAGAVCVSCIGNIGYTSITTKKCITNQQINSIIVNQNNDADFVYYLVKNLRPVFKNYEGQSTTLSILNKTQFSKITVCVPELSIQKKIARLLSSLDDKIELNNAINHNLEQQAQALYHQMFCSMPHPDWRNGVLSDIAVVVMGQSPDGKSYNEDGIGTVFYQGRAEFGTRFPTQRLFTTEPKRMAQENDVLISVRAPVGDLNVAKEDCCIGRGLGAVRSKDGHQSFVLYTMFALRSQLNVFNGEGTVFGSINRDSLNSLPVIIPPIAEINKFEALVAPMDKAIRTNYDEICHLQSLRDALLPRLMSGEIDVSDVEL